LAALVSWRLGVLRPRRRIIWPELPAPPPDRLVGDDNAALELT
jgi:hypothetical protein